MCSMKCTIPGVSLKVFGRAIQSLSKIGDELYFEPLEDGLYLRSVNSCRSAYACFQFSPNFFLHYVDGKTGADETDEALRCKVGMKSIMTVFKSISTIDKTVEKCRISLNMTEARLVFQMYCRHGIIKTHNLAFIECETLQAVFSKDMCPNKLTAAPKLVCDAVLNFQNNQEEITLIVRPDFVAMKNYVDDEPDPNKVIHTELTLSPDEFDHYQVGLDTDITFCLKEFRAILAFADITALPVTLHFETAGRPVTFSIDSDLSFEANFVLATLADEDSSQAPTTSTASRQAAGKTGNNQKRGAGVRTSSRNGESASSRNSSHPNNVHAERNGKSIKPTASNPGPSRDAPRPSASTDDAFNDNDEYSMAVMDITAPEESMSHSMPAEPSSYPGRRREAENKDVEGQSTLSDRGDYNGHGDRNGMEENEYDEWGRGVEKANDFTNQYPALSFGGNEGEHGGHRSRSTAERLAQSEEQSSQNEDRLQGRFFRTHEPEHSSTKRSDSASCDGPAVKGKLLSLKSAATRESDSSPVIPVQDPGLAHDSVMQDVEEEEEDEEIPATPPSKKFRSVFFGTQSSTQPSQSQQKSAILAPDSDDDD